MSEWPKDESNNNNNKKAINKINYLHEIYFSRFTFLFHRYDTVDFGKFFFQHGKRARIFIKFLR